MQKLGTVTRKLAVITCGKWKMAVHDLGQHYPLKIIASHDKWHLDPTHGLIVEIKLPFSEVETF